LESCELLRAGYAVEYDMVPPTELHAYAGDASRRRIISIADSSTARRDTRKRLRRFDCRYQRRAARHRSSRPLRLARSQAYIGVLIDDVVTKGVDEPYRMLTSPRRTSDRLGGTTMRTRALTPRGREIGLVGDDGWRSFQLRQAELVDGLKRGATDARRRRHHR